MATYKAKVRLVTSGSLRAFAQVIIDDEFVVHDVRVIEGEKGVFVSMPSKKNNSSAEGAKEFVDIAHPIKADSREKLIAAVLAAYEEAVTEAAS